MKPLNLLYIILVTVLLTSCGKKEFRVKADFPQTTSSIVTLTYYAADKRIGWISEVPLSVTNGKGEVLCSAIRPSVVWVSTTNSVPTGPQMWFWAERGDEIVLSGDNKDPLMWDVSGNEINEKWTKWRKENSETLLRRNAKSLNAVVAKYVQANTDDEFSALLLLTVFMRGDDEAQYVKLWNSLSDDARSAQIISAVGRADQPTGANADTAPRVVDFKLHCKGDTIINFKTRDYDAITLYFELGDEDMHHRDIDSIRSLLKSKGDLPRFKVIDVSFLRDSITWKNVMEYDSLRSEALVRAWSPGGRMHSSVMPFSVPASPWFVVLDNKGVQRYRGPEAAEAMKMTRLLLKNTMPQDSVKP